jgi:hypothetical protein
MQEERTGNEAAVRLVAAHRRGRRGGLGPAASVDYDVSEIVCHR